MNVKEIAVDGYVDSIRLRFDFVDKNLRDVIYSKLMNFVKETRLVGLSYDDKRSNSFYHCTKLINSNTTLADISKSGYPNLHSQISNYFISISFHGLKRYIHELDKKSELLLKNIMAFINSDMNTVPCLSQFDICSDITCNIDNLVVVCLNRKSRKQYTLLGDYDLHGNKIQLNDGTYEIEKFTKDEDKENFNTDEELKEAIAKRRANVQKRANFYNKREKILKKHTYDIGYDLSRFEMKLQARYFVNNEVSVEAFLRELKDYKVLYFEDIKEKEKFIEMYNKANSNKHRTKLLSKVKAITVKTNMYNIGEFIRMVDTIRFRGKNKFSITKKEDYLYGRSKFNRKNKILK